MASFWTSPNCNSSRGQRKIQIPPSPHLPEPAGAICHECEDGRDNGALSTNIASNSTEPTPNGGNPWFGGLNECSRRIGAPYAQSNPSLGSGGAEQANDLACPKQEGELGHTGTEPERTDQEWLPDLIRWIDDTGIGNRREDVNTLLFFAGVFSAIVAAFFVGLHWQQSKDAAAEFIQILHHASREPASRTGYVDSMHSTIAPFSPTRSPSSRSSVRSNILWSLSLVLALIVASFEVFVKQWTDAYIVRGDQKQVTLRLYRDVGVYKWRVFEIARFLPLLLQLAHLLFFLGFVAACTS